MNPKLIILFVLSLLMGVTFIGVGFYFGSKRFLNKLNESCPTQSPEAFAKNKIRSKGSSIVSLALGGLTLIWGLCLFLFPQIASILALIYMISLIIAFVFISFVFK